ncbi:MAG: Dabb family protein [Planctomycetota bacterium]
MARLAHQVFFTLHDRSDSAIETLMADCQTYLHGHDGMVGFAVGRREPKYERPVNADYDVALHTVFATQDDHDAYQTAPRHLEFVGKHKDTWAEVQVFDSNLAD